MLQEPIVLYSVNTWLAYMIAERYYRGIHYVWCTPHFDPSSEPPLNYIVPPSSSPVEIYRTLRKDISSGDRHSAKIDSNKSGILRGVKAKRSEGVIDHDGEEEITSIIEVSDVNAFRPMCYVIPFCLVRDRARPVPIGERAHPLSPEFKIEALPRNCFDAIGLEGI